MTPGARVAAAIEVLDLINTGEHAERVLTRWARQNRFAGSKDRAAIRDDVYDVLRRRETAAVLGGGTNGRSLMIGLLRQREEDLAAFFSGQGHAPAALNDTETSQLPNLDAAEMLWDLPEWVISEFSQSLGEQARDAAKYLRERAPITIRCNVARTSRSDLLKTLSDAGITAVENPVAQAAISVIEGARRLRNSTAFQDGLFELQDAASQAVVEGLPLASDVLDYCAGGGGKALALAMRGGCRVTAHDIDPQRMRDIPTRANRAGVRIKLAVDRPERGRFDLVLCDAPCSGSGSWRRDPAGKWALTPDRLEALQQTQDAVLDAAAAAVSPTGTLAYATCSVLKCENEDRVQAFLSRHSDWRLIHQRRLDISAENDGFYTAHLTRGAASL